MKILTLTIMAVMLSATVFAALTTQYVSPFEFPQRSGVERITHFDPRVNSGRTEYIAYLEPAIADKGVGVGRGGYDPIYPRGTADVRTVSYYGYPRTNVVIKVTDLQSSDDKGIAYEAWLVDTDTEYRLSLGTFRTVRGGTGQLTYNAQLSTHTYDLFEITAEPMQDYDVLPGAVVLVAALPRNTQFMPEPAQKKLLD